MYVALLKRIHNNCSTRVLKPWFGFMSDAAGRSPLFCQPVPACAHTHTHAWTLAFPPRFCCGFISTCGYYSSHLSLALCFIALPPLPESRQLLHSVVPGGEPPLGTRTHTHFSAHAPVASRPFHPHSRGVNSSRVRGKRKRRRRKWEDRWQEQGR